MPHNKQLEQALITESGSALEVFVDGEIVRVGKDGSHTQLRQADGFRPIFAGALEDGRLIAWLTNGSRSIVLECEDRPMFGACVSKYASMSGVTRVLAAHPQGDQWVALIARSPRSRAIAILDARLRVLTETKMSTDSGDFGSAVRYHLSTDALGSMTLFRDRGPPVAWTKSAGSAGMGRWRKHGLFELSVDTVILSTVRIGECVIASVIDLFSGQRSLVLIDEGQVAWKKPLSVPLTFIGSTEAGSNVVAIRTLSEVEVLQYHVVWASHQ